MVRGVRRNLNALMDAQANPALPRPQRLALGSNAESTQFPLVNHNVQQPHELSKQLRSEMNRLRTVEDVDIFNEWFTESDRVKQRGTKTLRYNPSQVNVMNIAHTEKRSAFKSKPKKKLKVRFTKSKVDDKHGDCRKKAVMLMMDKTLFAKPAGLFVAQLSDLPMGIQKGLSNKVTPDCMWRDWISLKLSPKEQSDAVRWLKSDWQNTCSKIDEAPCDFYDIRYILELGNIGIYGHAN